MSAVSDAVSDLTRVFRTNRDKHAAHERARPLMEQLTREPRFLTAALAQYLEQPRSLERGNYPVVGIELALNPFFGLVINGWIPLPDRRTDVSTKCIHHHGELLLTTASLFGPGYEHWVFSAPRVVDERQDLYAMDVVEVGLHPQHHVAFVDHHIPHVPMYPADTSLTLALWSSRHPVTWREHVKRLPGVRGREEMLRRIAVRLGLGSTLRLNVIELFDFFPVAEGFRGMKVREEFGLGSNEDHLHSVFHIIQKTGNEALVPAIQRRIDRSPDRGAREVASRLLDDLRRGRPIEGRLSTGHYGVPHANFTSEEIRASVSVLEARRGADGRQFTAA